MSKIDVHSHIVPPIFRDSLNSCGKDRSGWGIPDWTPESAIECQDANGVKTGILSITTPGCTFLDVEGNRKLARECNRYAAKVHADHPGRFGTYVNIPDLKEDLEGCMEEIKYGLDTLEADGVCLMTSYGGYYLGHPYFTTLWQEMDRRRATVLIHPTPPEGYQPMPAQEYCPCPAFEFPHETTKTVSDIIMSGRRLQCPNVNIVLCHGGGTIPYLFSRIAFATTNPLLKNPLTSSEVTEQFKTFYYDTALVGISPALDLTIAFAPEDKLVIGTDHPYAPLHMILAFAKGVNEFKLNEERRHQLHEGNAVKIFPRLGH